MSKIENLEGCEPNEIEETVFWELYEAGYTRLSREGVFGNFFGVAGSWNIERTKSLFVAQTPVRDGMPVKMAEQFRTQWCTDVCLTHFGVGRYNLFGVIPLPRRVVHRLYLLSYRALKDFRILIENNRYK